MPICPACNTQYDDSVVFCPRDGTKLEEHQESTGPSRVGQILADRYRIKKLLGAGGMGEVYIAEHVYINKKVALKLLRPEITSNKEAVVRFQREAQATSTIGHENIILIDDFGKLPDGSVYFTMELLDGEDLSNIMLREPLAAPRALGIVIQICRGLAAAHSKDIIHRDMKPENVFVTRDKDGKELAKILDFGIAKVNEAGDSNLTQTGQVFGTPHYMSPEQAMGKPLDHRADIYSVGVIMYEMFTGTVPFKAESFIGILTKHVTEVAVPPRQAAPDRQINPDVEAIILKAMDKERDNRYASMDEMLQELGRVERSVSSFHDAVRPEGPLDIPPPPPASPGAPGTGGWTQMPASATQAPAQATAQNQAASQPALPKAATGPFTPPSASNPATMPPPGTASPVGTASQPSMPGVPPVTSGAYTAAGVPPAPVKKSSAGLIIGLILGLIVVFGGGGASAWYFLWGPGSGGDEASEGGGEGEELAREGSGDAMKAAAGDAGVGAGGMTVEGGPSKIKVKSNPIGAKVTVSGKVVGTTPCDVKLPDDGKVLVYLAMKGHETKSIRLGRLSPAEVVVDLKPRGAGASARGSQSGSHRGTGSRDSRHHGNGDRPRDARVTRGSSGSDASREVREPSRQRHRHRARERERPRERTRDRTRHRPRERTRRPSNPFDDDEPATRTRTRGRASPFDD